MGVFWGADEEISDGGSPRVIVLGYDGLPIQPVAPPSPDYIPDSEEPQTPPVPQDEDEREPMFIQPHDPDYVPEPIYPEYIPLEDEHEFPAEEQPLPPVVSPTAESPGYVVESDPEEDPEEYKDDETEDGPVDYPMDGGEDGDDDDGDSSGDDADDEDEDEGDEDDEDEEEEEEHLAPADSAVVVPTVELASISLPPEAEVERLLAMPTPSPSPPISLSPPSAGERLARCTAPPALSSPPPVPSPLLPSSGCPTQIQTLRMASTQTLVDAVTAALPSPPLPPLPLSLYIPPPIDHRDDLPESELPPRKRLCLSTLGSKYEVRESSTARPTGGRGIDYGFVSTIDAEARRHGISEETIWIVDEETYASREAWGHSIRLSQAVYHELQTHRDYVYAYETHIQAHQAQLQLQITLIQTQHEAELLAIRGQQRARQPGPDARIPDDQDASGDADSNIYKTPPMEMEATVHTGITEGMYKLRALVSTLTFRMSTLNCKGTKVKFATCTLLGAALTWWNGQIRTLGPDAYSMTWEVLKKKMTDKYCPQGEIKKLEIELWNLKVKGNDVPAYTERFQELTLICTKFVANETEKVDKYIGGLPDNIYGNVKSARPKTLDETIELANDLMDQKLRTYAERQSDNKRKADDSSRNNHGHQQQPFKRQNVAKVYNMGTSEKKPYGGSLPKSSGNTNGANTQKGNRVNPKGNGCFECGSPGHFKRDCPKLKNKDRGNGNAQGWVYAEKRGNASGNPDPNVVTGTFLLNNRYASILFDTGSDKSFISSAFSSLIDIAQTPLENSYDVELADGKIVGDWLRRTVMISRENLVSDQRLISCSKAQRVRCATKDVQIFLAYRDHRRPKEGGQVRKDTANFKDATNIYSRFLLSKSAFGLLSPWVHRERVSFGCAKKHISGAFWKAANQLRVFGIVAVWVPFGGATWQ
ncbi:putative reverse transcriptase domain-containing protein [Tanacetum coccineum]|uniref:Reverse transcriptase domain-containing protein n=1 Tax=Tanacetum coccineum TaxID=301880 RepID=A0ABQ5CWK6_9ASTR